MNDILLTNFDIKKLIMKFSIISILYQRYIYLTI